MKFLLGVLAGAFAVKAYGREDVKQRVSGYGGQIKDKLLELGILKRRGVAENTGEVGSTEYGTSPSYEPESTGFSGSASTSGGGFGSSSVSGPPYGRH